MVIAYSFPCSWYYERLSMNEQLQNGRLQKDLSLSSPSPERLRSWRLLRERARAGRRARRGAPAPGRHSAALVRRPGPARGVPEGVPMNELAERILLEQERLHARRRQDRGSGARPPRTPRARPPDDPRRAHRQRRPDDERRPPLPPKRNRRTLRGAPHRQRDQGPRPAPSRKSAPTPARFAPAASAANPSPSPRASTASSTRSRETRTPPAAAHVDREAGALMISTETTGMREEHALLVARLALVKRAGRLAGGAGTYWG